MAPTKRSVEEIRRQKKECERRRRAKIKANPELHEQAKAKERERYRKRKEEMEILPIEEMSSRKQRQQRKEWRKRQKKCRENRKCAERFLTRLREDSPPSSDSEAMSARSLSPSLLQNYLPRILDSPSSVHSSSVRSLSRDSSSLRESTPPLLINTPSRRLESPSSSSTTSYQKKAGLKAAKRNRFILQKKLKLQDKMISNLKKKINALRMKTTREKILTPSTKKTTEIQNKLNTLAELNTIRQRRVAVIHFFENDENTRLCAGKRDVITRNKIKKQKRILNDTIGNLYKKFIAENPCKMSYATFCRLKPFWVLQANIMKRDTCLCIIHENIKFVVDKLHFLRITRQPTIDDIAKEVVCDIHSDRCILRQCVVCKDRVPFINTFIDSSTCYKQWIVKKEPRVINGTEKIIKRTIKDTITISKVDLVNLLIEMIPKYLIHKQIITNQYRHINNLKNNMDLLLHIDFSENYQTKYTEEIQSVHFGASRQQLTLHTAVVYYRDLITGQIITRSFCTLSENLRHDACAVYAHILPVLHKINEISPIYSLHVLSDAPSTQYRNKCMFYIFSNLLPKVFNLKKAEWSYSAPGHGKGAPDGVGGYTKRTADRIVSEGKDIPDIQTFFKVLCSQESNITYMLVTDSDIDKVDSIVPKDLQPIRGTISAYQTCWNKVEENVIYLRRLSCGECVRDCSHYGIGKYTYISTAVDGEVCPGPSRHMAYEVPEKIGEETHLSNKSLLLEMAASRVLCVGNWAIIRFVCKKTEVFYIGQIMNVNGSKYLIKFLRKKKKCDDLGYTEFAWPQCDDISEVNDEDIVCTLPQPLCGRRNIFSFQNDSINIFSNLR